MPHIASSTLRLVLLPLGAQALGHDETWYSAATTFHFPAVYVKDFDGDRLAEEIQESPHPFVFVDFYAPWCPHCQHFAPQLEMLALAQKKAGGDRTLFGQVDCVRYSDTCSEWGIHAYPSFFFGPKEKAPERGEPDVGLTQVEPDNYTAHGVAAWLLQRGEPDLVPGVLSIDMQELMPKEAKERAAAGNVSEPVPEHWDMQLGLALFIRNALSYKPWGPVSEKIKTEFQERWTALEGFVEVAATNFPEASAGDVSCQTSLQELQQKMAAHREDASMDPDELEASWKLCGTDWEAYKASWRGCRATWPGKRGYTCGLWTMFHGLAAHTTDSNASSDLLAVRQAVGHLFGCEECRKHFMTFPTPEEMGASELDRKGAMLWWWHAHNLVNQRVMKIEQDYDDSDPAFVKRQWPGADLCPTCQAKAGGSFLKLEGRTTSHLEAQKTAITSFQSHWLADQDDPFKGENWNLDSVAEFLDSSFGSKEPVHMI